ncbi:glycoside hydrolase family 2 TIM barrel-domain containing protein [Microbacterium sp. NPDC089698]|uniref:glycoside hydrolase family 2 TIM barrel-domain containing protein n=1 Tax=Microbacterium sp. NPDC089698 TaxID=3364200 RepID=UPI0038132578
MRRTSFNDDWQFRRKVNPFDELSGEVEPYVDVFVPHDALIGEKRDPDGDPAGAYFPTGTYEYRKTFTVPDDPAHRRVAIEFEGVYRDAAVFINGAYAGNRPYGYSDFVIDADEHLNRGQENTVRVECRNGQDSRWYTGAGIYRDVWLHFGRAVHIPVHGLRVSTTDIDDLGAMVEVEVSLENSGLSRETVDVEVLVFDPDGKVVAGGIVPVTVAAAGRALSRQRLYVNTPRLWSAESPSLYRAGAEVRVGDELIDESESRFGIRRLQVDPLNGFRVNGHPVDLRGACIHHDNGILGSATVREAEERRVRLLKEAGFNAIRSAHNPMSVPLLDACDRLGMYVIDETFDTWNAPKMDRDYSLAFPDWWERDVESLVAKDFNHPSVIAYCIGNEVTETGSASGGIIGRAIAEKVRTLDPTRFVTNAINGLLAVMDDAKAIAAQRGQAADDGTAINTLMAGPMEIMREISASPLVTSKTAESFGVLDIAGMNYIDSRYELDKTLFPNRVIVGTETFPTTIDRTWQLVRDNPHVIGDFTWSGFDYLGEVGLGRTQYLSPGEAAEPAPFPWIAAWCGDLDLIGGRRPSSFYREIVFRRRAAPYLAVRRPAPSGTSPSGGPWAWSDSLASWTWNLTEGTVLEVEAYSDAEEVELRCNGRVVDRKPAGVKNRFKALFEVPYELGTLSAIAIREGQPGESFELESARGEPRLSVVLEPAMGQHVFVRIEIVDAHGVVMSNRDRSVHVDVFGPFELVALGSGNPAPTQAYDLSVHDTFDGRALAVLRRTGDGNGRLRIRAAGCGGADVALPG